MDFNNFEWFKKLRAFDRIMIFGAKSRAIETYWFIIGCQRDIECYLVSERKDNPFNIDGKPVKVFHEIDEDMKKNGLVVISQIYESDDAMRGILCEAGFLNIISSATQMTDKMPDELKDYYASAFSGMKAVEEFAQQNPEKSSGKRNITIYAVTSQGNMHKAIRTYDSKFIKYIQAGAALSDHKICEITDDAGGEVYRNKIHISVS